MKKLVYSVTRAPVKGGDIAYHLGIGYTIEPIENQQYGSVLALSPNNSLDSFSPSQLGMAWIDVPRYEAKQLGPNSWGVLDNESGRTLASIFSKSKEAADLALRLNGGDAPLLTTHGDPDEDDGPTEMVIKLRPGDAVVVSMQPRKPQYTVALSDPEPMPMGCPGYAPKVIDREDWDWVRDTHKVDITDAAVIQLFGNEDAPHAIFVFDVNHYKAYPLRVYMQDAEGNLELTRVRVGPAMETKDLREFVEHYDELQVKINRAEERVHMLEQELVRRDESASSLVLLNQMQHQADQSNAGGFFSALCDVISPLRLAFDRADSVNSRKMRRVIVALYQEFFK